MRTLPRLGVPAVALCVAVTLVAPPATGGSAGTGARTSLAAFTPGAPGIGDPYFPTAGNGGYDVDSYDLALRYDPADNSLSGSATVRATATQNLSAFDLDLDGLTVRAVSVEGRPAAWTRSGTELVITPDAGLPAGGRFTVAVRYDGVPRSPGDEGFMATDDGALIAGEPDVAATWFPVNDHPRDRATYTTAVTVPDDRQVIANGVPLGRVVADPGWSTWRWEGAGPMAPYLVTLAVGDWDVTTRTVDGIDYLDAIDVDLVGTETGDVAREAFARQPEILDFLAGLAGPYPFTTAGGIVDDYRPLGFALETQTRPVYSRAFFGDAESATSVVVHELAHQWFGDSLTVDTWSEVWLNEGFATYAQWLWSEHDGGDTAQERFEDAYSRPSDAGFWELEIGDPGADRLFDPAVYDRGAMTLHALRREIGDADFFALLRRWATERAGATVRTTDFVTMAERVSGESLGPLFETWLFTGSQPPAP